MKRYLLLFFWILVGIVVFAVLSFLVGSIIDSFSSQGGGTGGSISISLMGIGSVFFLTLPFGIILGFRIWRKAAKRDVFVAWAISEVILFFFLKAFDLS